MYSGRDARLRDMPVRVADLVALGVAETAISRAEDPQEPRDAWPTGLKGGGRSRTEAPLLVRPASARMVAAIVAWAGASGQTIQVQGGRSNVVGALDSAADLVLDLSSLDVIGELDPVNLMITAGAGVLGERLELFLDQQGFTLGHQPQSLPTSTVGGWVATRATGAASALFGGIERLVCGLEFVLPTGELVEVGPRPRSPGGLDAIALLCGTEGSLAIITAVTLSIARRLPERRLVAVFPDLTAGLEVQRALVQDRLPVAVLRVLNPTESAALAPPGSIAAGACLLVASLESTDAVLKAAERTSHRIVRSGGGRIVDPALAAGWWQHQYAPAGLIEGRNRPAGEMFDTIEVSVRWSSAADAAQAIGDAVRPLVEQLWLHSSHAYPSGTCLYLAFWIKAPDDGAAIERCRTVWEATLHIVEQRGGSYGHHHGIGAARSQRYGDSAEGRIHRLIKAAIDPQLTFSARLFEGAGPITATGVGQS
jgi:alkyldihydroxyacetonephosphate synthase